MIGDISHVKKWEIRKPSLTWFLLKQSEAQDPQSPCFGIILKCSLNIVTYPRCFCESSQTAPRIALILELTTSSPVGIYIWRRDWYATLSRFASPCSSWCTETAPSRSASMTSFALFMVQKFRQILASRTLWPANSRNAWFSPWGWGVLLGCSA